MKTQIKKFTFKNQSTSGKYSSFFTKSIEVKVKGKAAGWMCENWNTNTIDIYFHALKNDTIKDNNPNCKFKNVKLDIDKFTNFNDAKSFLNSDFLNWYHSDKADYFEICLLD